MPRRITAAICTYNRAEYLPGAIESLLKQHLPPADFEVLVVDNGSTDATPAVAERCMAAAAPISARLGVEHRLGLAHARNLAVQMAEGDVVAFLDDDAIASPDWLAALLDAYAAFPDALCVGGKVLLRWQAPRPEWLTDDLLIELSMLDIGKETRVLARNEHIWGTNCSFRRKAVAEAGGFRPELGRRGELLIGQEETELQARLRHNGQVVYTPHATVYHLVPPSRLRQHYFVRRAYGTGRSRALRDATTLTTATQWKVAASLTFAAAKGCLRMLAQFDNAVARLRCTRGNALMFGYWQETLRRRGGARSADHTGTRQ
jgi:glucosyl-dolichyl phosphate glucuronosyltransferase